ncbi:hypothetical protein BC832DRAFT_487234 [Gaertneriomyces semiglobifer]|nr:hypothetical protein BC832DRAFT_487234 [Gaertneriomyces semiglobifer]
MSGRRPSALGRLSVTAGAAALAAQSELDPLANAQVESAIPDDLKEHPPPESLFSLDKRMEELLMDIRNLMESRGKDWQGTSGRKDRVPGISWVTRLENFKQHRAEWIERIMRVEVPKRWEGIGKVVGSELEGYWNVDVNLTREKLLYILQEFYCLKSTLMAEQNALLLSRWTRFCRTSYDISKYLPMFQRYQEYLQAEYTDAVDRYERLSEAWERRERLIREELAKAEAERIERERRGIIPPRKADKDKNTPGKQSQSEAAPAPAAESDPLYTVADLVVFLRYVITAMAGRKDVEMFLQRARLLAHSDRSAILRDYRAVCTVKPSQGALEVLGILEGVNNYVENPPVKFPRVEDFITEFDLLVAHYMFQTPIAREDGRPFAYEAESVFTTVFLEQSNEATMAPYDLGDSSEWNLRKDNGSDDIKDKHGDKASLAAMAGLFTHQGFKNPDTPRFRRADWLKNMEIFPELEEWQEAQIEFIRQKRDIDFELRYEHDFLMSNDIELVINRLRDASRRTHEANGAPSARPSSGRTQSQDQSDYPRPSVPSQQRDSGPSKPFEWGMKVPDPWDVEVEKDFRVLDAKKQTFGLLLKANDEKRHVEKEITGIPTAENSGSLLPSTAIVDPTVTTLFAPHETLSYLYLRHVRTRQLRATLLSQLNYFRSIEKRIVTAYQLMKRRQLSTDAPDDPDHRGRTPLARAAVVTHMWAQQELFDMPDPNSADATSATGNNDGCDDVQQIIDGKLVIKDAQGVAFIYDAAIDDMKGLEKAMLRIATAYINAAAVGQSTRDLSIDKDTLEREKIYEEEMRFKLSERKTDYNDAHYTFLNPDLDRSQLLLEMYDHEVKFQYAKIELINIYLEVYENTYDPTRITRITQIITDLMHLRPTFDFEGQTYFSRSYTLCTKALQLHAQTVLPMLQHGLEKHRDWVKKYFGRQDPTASRNDDDAEAIPEMNFNHGFKRVVDSPVMAGLPAKEDIERETITMHHAGCIVNMTEFIPTADAIIEVYDTAKAVCSEMSRVVSGLLLHAHMASAKDMPKHRLSRPAVECTVWKGLYATWQTLSTACFQIRQPRTRRLIGQLNADIWMENPLLPDLLLTDVYVPEMTDRALNVHFAAMTPFTDANFNTTGCDIGHRLLKVLVTRDRLMGIWLETEYLRKVYELQFPQMGVNMNAYSGRLNSLRFDLPEMADNTAIEVSNLRTGPRFMC